VVRREDEKDDNEHYHLPALIPLHSLVGEVLKLNRPSRLQLDLPQGSATQVTSPYKYCFCHYFLLLK
jgi:hypothetical protein